MSSMSKMRLITQIIPRKVKYNGKSLGELLIDDEYIQLASNATDVYKELGRLPEPSTIF